MNRAFWRCGLPLAAAVFLLFPSAYAQDHGRGRKYKPPPPTCNITVTVLRGDNKKPVEDAAVVFHPLKGGKNDGNMELKTNEQGKVSLNVVPIGTDLRLQVIATGFQTYGKDYDLPGATKEITVKLNLPQQQYSIYESHPTNDAGQATTQPQKPQ
ncbi:MAG: carboxypeptidase-like regulatory domain-containing protein [Acidobacteriaceae bacterium]